MTRARNQLISLNATPYYHTISRCVRRAFLCGEDSFSGKNYDHRKQWAIERLRELTGVFAIDICAYAIMSNHYHLVLRIDAHKASEWSETQVIERWRKLFNIPPLINRYLRGEYTSKAEISKARMVIADWRDRLSNISWFMRSLNEYLARKANEEDQCTGRFWEGRFKSQALLDEAAVLTCMSYVDLNPVRAGMSETPEASDFTSIQQRIRQVRKSPQGQSTRTNRTHLPLMPLVKQRKDPHKQAMGFTLCEYLQLIDWSGRMVKEGKRGAISEEPPPIFQRIGLEPSRFVEHLQGYAATEQQTAMGHFHKIRLAAQTLGRRFLKGSSEAQRLYVVTA
jgi:REP element-mobilizing transposase RayT